MGKVKELLLGIYDDDNIYKIEINTVNNTMHTIRKDELDIINDEYIQHGINGSFISYSKVVKLHQGHEVKQVVCVTQVYLQHIVDIQIYYNCPAI